MWDEAGFWYVVDIEYVAIEGDMAHAAGPITASSDPELVGAWFGGAALDAGGPGVEADSLWGFPTTMDEAVAVVTQRITPSPPLLINSGNVQVHSYE